MRACVYVCMFVYVYMCVLEHSLSAHTHPYLSPGCKGVLSWIMQDNEDALSASSVWQGLQLGNLTRGGVVYEVVQRGGRKGAVPKDGAYSVPHATPRHHMPQLPGLSTPL